MEAHQRRDCGESDDDARNDCARDDSRRPVRRLPAMRTSDSGTLAKYR